jgi:hypothetical protein
VNLSKGFGNIKVSSHKKERISISKALREIRNLAKGKAHKSILSEIRLLEPKVDTQKDAVVSTQELATELNDHQREWIEGSGIDPQITSLNLKSLDGTSPYEYLLYSDKLPRINTGRLSFSVLNRYHHLDDGGWWCSGVDVLTGDDASWGCFKPNNPKWDDEKEKYRKYDHPEKVLTEIFALKIPNKFWQLVARRYNVALPENYQELPHSAFWQWVIDHPQIPVIITEGAKKAGAVLSCGYVCIALPGIWNGIRQPKDADGNYDGMASLIPQLQVFAQAGRRIYFCFDKDTNRNTVRSVNKAIARTAKLFLLKKCEVNIITWNPAMGKGIDDVLVAFKKEQFDQLYQKALNFDDWQSLQLKNLTYKPDEIINERYISDVLPSLSVRLITAQLIALKSPKGTGKTEFLRLLTDPILRSGERRVLLITHRVQLGIPTCGRMGIPFVSELKTFGEGSLFGYGLCVDSLHPQSQAHFNPQEWKGAWVILDEVQQILWHLLSSSTCEDNRVAIVKTLQELLKLVIETGGKIILADADLNDISIDFIESLLGCSPERFILVNEYKFAEPWNVYKFDGRNPKVMLAQLERKLKAEEKALLCVSSQKEKSKWGSTDLEHHFKKKCPDIKILRIDSVTVQNPDHEACGCTENLNEIVTKYDLVIASPTIETGVSIDVQHFDSVWFIGQGVHTTDGARQHLSRYRPPVPRYVWIASKGLTKIGNGMANESSLIASEKSKDKANRAKLLEAGLQEMPDGTFSPICLTTWAKIGAIINQGMWKYEETILRDLEEEGHTIINWKDSDEAKGCTKDNEVNPDTLEKEVTENRDEVYLNFRVNTSSSESTSESEYRELSKKQGKNNEEILRYRKGQIEHKYLVACTPELILKDDNKWHGKIKLHYLWDKGREFLPFKDTQSMERSIIQGKGDYFIIDSNRKLMQLKVKMLDYLEISRLYEETGFHNTHPVVAEIVQRIKGVTRDIQKVSGVDVSKLVKKEEDRIECLKAILRLLGHTMVCYARKGKRGEQIRYYSSPAPEFSKNSQTKKLILDENGLPIPLSDGREAVFEAWLKRDAEARRKAEEEKAAFFIEPVQMQKSPCEEGEPCLPTIEEQHKMKMAEAQAEQVLQELMSEESVKYVANILEECDTPEKREDIYNLYPDEVLQAATAMLQKTPAPSAITVAVVEELSIEHILAKYRACEYANQKYSVGQYVEVLHEGKMKIAKVLEMSDQQEIFFCKVEFIGSSIEEKVQIFYDPSIIFLDSQSTDFFIE